MTDTQTLLAEYTVNGSEAAFRELVERYVDFVYSTALRLVGRDTHAAQDVTQVVFMGLARKAGKLSKEVMLGGWLHQHTFHVATKSMRSERRRQARERAALEMNTFEDDSGANLRPVAPILDEAITRLTSSDRAAILLRFFEQRDFRSVGLALGINQDAARMRVNRALEKLHDLLKERGVSLSVAALGSALTTEAVTAAPVGLAAVISSAALASTVMSAGTTFTLLKVMTASKVKFGLTVLAIAGTATTLIIQHRSQMRVREENRALRQQSAQLTIENEALSARVARGKAIRGPRLPAPLPQRNSAPTAEPTETSQVTSLYAQLMGNRPAKLSAAQVEPYLQANQRNAASLLAAFRTTGDQSLLEEAMRKYPDDSQVSFEAALRKDSSPEEQRRWLDTFKESAPENSLPDYLSAADHAKAGRMDQAVQELLAASGKSQFEDYSLARVQDDEEAYRAAGYPVAQSKLAATMQLLLPQLAQVKQLSEEMVNLAGSYRQAGDENSAQTVLEMTAKMGQRYSSGSPGQSLISQLVGIAVERKALSAMNPDGTYDAAGQTVRDRVNQLVHEREAIQNLNQQADSLWSNLSEQDWISYQSRSTVFGERSALRWLVDKHGQK